MVSYFYRFTKIHNAMSRLVLEKLVDPSTGKSLKEYQLKQELIQQTSLIKHCLKFLHCYGFNTAK